MKTTPYLALVMFMTIIVSWAEPAPLENQILLARIENVKYDKKSSEITLKFIITNNSQQSISIAERWNSWGAFQWSFQLVGSDGKLVNYTNPQRLWTKNYLTVVKIAPGKELSCSCLLVRSKSKQSNKNIAVFTPLKNKDKLAFPVKITGVFEIDELYSEDKVTTNWMGKLKTKTTLLRK